MREDRAIHLPDQDVHGLAEKAEQVRQQQAFLAQLRAEAGAHGDMGLVTAVDALEQQYRAAEHSRLHEDVYLSAAHEPASPGLGYFRASESPEVLRKLGIEWSQEQLRDLLQPDHSDFRAEIYLPDPVIYGTDATPVIVYKGSSGPVVAQDEAGRAYARPSELADWIENGRQALGLESDHYNRAMRLATEFKRDYLNPFEIGGHSKGGGQALAAAAVTGMPAYTFNAATLHPDTASRYARQNGLQLHDVDALAHGHYVKGEVLHDGLAVVHGMDPRHQARVVMVLRQLGELAQLPESRQRLDVFLRQSLPYDRGMQDAAMQLVDALAARANGDRLREVPGHAGAGRLVELPAMGRDADGELFARRARPSLHAASVANIPLLEAMTATTTLGVAGKRAGEAVAVGGALLEQGARVAGEGARTGWQVAGQVAGAGSTQAGAVLGATVRYQGEVIAGARLAGGQVEAGTQRALGAAGQWSNQLTGALLRTAGELPFMDGLRDAAERNGQVSDALVQRRHAGVHAAIDEARRDAGAIGQVAGRAAGNLQQTASAMGRQWQAQAAALGDFAADGFRTVGATVRVASGRAPALGAAGGLALGVAGSLEPVDALPLAVGLGIGQRSAAEALARHGMKDVVQPSMDARTRAMEQEALQRLQWLRSREPARAAPAHGDSQASLLIDDPRHAAFGLYQGAERGVHAEDARLRRQPDLGSRQLAASLAAEMHLAGGSRIDHVLLGSAASTAFGVQGRLEDPAHLRVSVDTAVARETPVAESTRRVALGEPLRVVGQALAIEGEHRGHGPLLQRP